MIMIVFPGAWALISDHGSVIMWQAVDHEAMGPWLMIVDHGGKVKDHGGIGYRALSPRGRLGTCQGSSANRVPAPLGPR